MINGLDKIYIIHYAPLKERRLHLEKRLKELGLNDYAVWMVSENEDFAKKDLHLHDSSEKARAERKKILGLDKYPNIGKIDVAMLIQHIQILRMIVKSKNDRISMVFEDDVLLSDDFPEKLSLAIKKLNSINWDICYTDRGALFVDPIVKNSKKDEISLYEPPNKGANTTGSYIVSRESAKKILKIMKRFSLPPDMEMTYIQKKHHLKVYWTVPFLTRQGSIEYVYKSNVRRGSLTGILMKIIRSTEKISPQLALIIARFSDILRKTVYSSKILDNLKVKLKSLLRY